MPATDAHPGQDPSPPRVLVVVNVEWFFLSHRLPIALGLKRAGCDVEVAAGVEQGLDGEIERQGLPFTRLALRRASMNPLHDLMLLFRLYRLYREKRPDVVHHVAIKPVLYGSLAARLARVPAIVNAVPGLGFLFSEGTGLRAIKSRLAMLAYRVSCRGRHVRLIFQNPEDRDSFIAAGVTVPERTVLIRGSGVNVERFQPSPEPESESGGPPIVLMASRMLWDKGVAELVEAGRLLRAAGGQSFRIVLAGDPDVANPRSVPAAQLEAWQAEGAIEWWGHQRDMPAVMRQAALVVFPSFYREGVPKVLLEACAAGRAIVTTDLPGCREVVKHGENGLLVPPRDVRALADAIAALLADPARRARMGRAGRVRAVEEFSEASVVDATLRLYREILGSRWPGIIPPEPEGRTLGASRESRTSA
jgi:glycosyltransferase involved in cell wall biosynthesis